MMWALGGELLGLEGAVDEDVLLLLLPDRLHLLLERLLLLVQVRNILGVGDLWLLLDDLAGLAVHVEGALPGLRVRGVATGVPFVLRLAQKLPPVLDQRQKGNVGSPLVQLGGDLVLVVPELTDVPHLQTQHLALALHLPLLHLQHIAQQSKQVSLLDALLIQTEDVPSKIQLFIDLGRGLEEEAKTLHDAHELLSIDAVSLLNHLQAP
mmetsp:Transcript_38423/g.36782  ORF Transcript_38423/g.36782 Transcript_38423/m.36782 type:complete len:209 (-) Transcript_38423:349-975(-)